ncbi:hypothetical protein TNIN_396721 [Trichonephila inaurata madagascariensis]|uniref:Uncharacterized protein n=1 Tax=Trichonephila inaurata madagascariensis TaxID=2747483 RepID=A0A8X6YUS9_9ARAC|nr:hypothetical protein TNIN_396721 [Trichonephila inaurata madagascariensis]
MYSKYLKIEVIKILHEEWDNFIVLSNKALMNKERAFRLRKRSKNQLFLMVHRFGHLKPSLRISCLDPISHFLNLGVSSIDRKGCADHKLFNNRLRVSLSPFEGTCEHVSRDLCEKI